LRVSEYRDKTKNKRRKDYRMLSHFQPPLYSALPGEAAGERVCSPLAGDCVLPTALYIPKPLSVTTCGLPPPLSTTFSVAFRDPFACGVKVTLMVQVAPGATLVPQVLVWAKSPGFDPQRGEPLWNV
jgi:hypothetical protein